MSWFEVRPLPTSIDPATALTSFRAGLAETTWADQTPDTLFAPVWTSAASAERFSGQVRQLYLAHLEVLRRLLAAGPFSPAGARYAELATPVRDFYMDWPGIEDPFDPAILTADDRLSRLFGRPDVVLSQDGPKAVETNFDTAAAGQERPDDMWRMAAEIFGPDAEYLRFGRPLLGMSDYFVELARGESAHVHWIMKDDPVARREMGPLVAVLNEAQQVVRHTLHYPGDDLAAIDSAGGRQLLHRAVSIFSVNKDRERFGELLAALRAVAPECTVPIGLSPVSSKLFLAWLSDPAARPDDLPAEQVAAIEALVPWTRVLSELPEVELDRVIAQPAEYVLKKADSYQATEVHLGWNSDVDQWREFLEAGRADSHPWIVQRRVRSELYRLTEYTDHGPIERATGLACCPYLMGGRLRGLETWITPPEPDLTMISRMQFVPHFIRS